MTFNPYLLENLDYDDAEPLLEDYINAALQAFIHSDVGKAYQRKHPQGGFWIGNFIEFAYLYGGFILPKMTKGNAQEVMEYILPRKLTLLDLSDTDNAIDELVAFWTYLDDVYRFRSARAIAKYLRSIADQFPQWMFSPERSGIAKTFMLQGVEAGFDMTTQEGVEAFQAEYNQRIRNQPPDAPLGMPTFQMTTPPPDMKQAFEELGLTLPAEGEQVNPMSLVLQFLGAIEQLDPEAADAFLGNLDHEDDAGIPPAAAGQATLRSVILRQNLGEEAPLSDEDKTILRNQAITETTPGTILKDFQTMLDFLGTDGIPVSSKLKQLSLKLLEPLNQQLSHPIQIDLKRPVQKSYPYIHGLYLLLRASQITCLVVRGKQTYLTLNPEIYASWQSLNPTEKYCSLFETWFLRSHPEMLGEQRSGPFSMGDRCLSGWPVLTRSAIVRFKQYADQDRLNYYPDLTNVALLEMFGLITVTSGKPSAGKGWRIKAIQATSFGRAMIHLMRNLFFSENLGTAAINDPSLPLGELQPALHPYFPEWQQSLQVPTMPFRSGRHIFKVSLGKIWRRIAISADATLAHLSSLILDSVEFDHDHLDEFTYQSPLGKTIHVTHPYGDNDLSTDMVKIGSLPLGIGSGMDYLFDFGDCWRFQVVLEAIEPEPISSDGGGFSKVKTKKKQKTRQSFGEVIESHGKAPEQYPEYDED